MASKLFQVILQGITVSVFMLIFISIIQSLPSFVWDVKSIGYILGAIKNFLSYFLYMFMAIAGKGAGLLFSFSIDYNHVYGFTIEPLNFQFLNLLFHMTDENGHVITYHSINGMFFGESGTPAITQMLLGQALTIVEHIYIFMFLLTAVLAVIYLLLFLGNSDIKYSLYSMLMLITPILIAIFPTLILSLLEMLLVPGIMNAASWVTFEANFRQYFPLITFNNDFFMTDSLPSSLEFFSNPTVLMGFLIYFYLELSFQTAYVARVIKPSILRTKRLESQISILGEKSALFEIEKQKRIQEVGQESSLMGHSEEQQRKIKLKDFFTGGGLDTIKELIEKQERDREKRYLEEVMGDTRRLNNYINRLFQIDKEAKDTLTAVGSAPLQKNLVLSSLINMGFRILSLFGLVYLAANPIIIFQVFRIPDIISSSVGFQSPEAIVTILVPIALLFPVVSFAIRTYKQYNLTRVILKKERESEMLRKISELREIEMEETVAPES
ncbi:MAG: hypothetical protein ACTSVI_07600 [Promethearchaeota archaeon]